ncbi:unnamed protein product, partial [Gulo gulo]
MYMKGPERRRRRMVMTMRIWHHPTRTFLPSQIQWLHPGLRGQEIKRRTPHFPASPQRSKAWTS